MTNLKDFNKKEIEMDVGYWFLKNWRKAENAFRNFNKEIKWRSEELIFPFEENIQEELRYTGIILEEYNALRNDLRTENPQSKYLVSKLNQGLFFRQN